MVAPGKGILAADESTGTIERRFDSIKVENIEENRRAYRDMLFTDEGPRRYISGVSSTTKRSARSRPTARRSWSCSRRTASCRASRWTSARRTAPVLSGEPVTEGLDGLPKRCAEYVKMGAKFAKWRAVITIGKDIPSATCIEENAHALARYAAICQEAGTRPDRRARSADGRRPHDRPLRGGHRVDAQCACTTRLSERVALEGSVLKPSMVISGKDCSQQAGVEKSPNAR